LWERPLLFTFTVRQPAEGRASDLIE